MAGFALENLRKRFGRTVALDGASLALDPGEIHALLGENGAGKTTLVRTLYGLVRPDAGRIQIDGEPVEIRNPAHALALGIGLVPQHPALVPALTVAENLVLGDRSATWLPPRALRARAAALLERYGLDADPDRAAGDLPLGLQQRLEIARALDRGVRLLVLDEPTAVLAPSEVEALLELLVRLRTEGLTVVLISHKLEEITAVCDRVTVLRAGRTVVTRPVEGVGRGDLGRWMVGEDAAAGPSGRGDPVPSASPPGSPTASPTETSSGPPVLRLSGVCAGELRNLDLEVRPGEILAVAGIDGNGQSSLEEVLAGVRPLEAGHLSVRPPVARIPGDRQRTGLVLGMSLAENLALVDAARGRGPMFRHGLLDRAALRAIAESAIRRFAVRGSPGDLAGVLSGGNQQKLLVARALRERPRVLCGFNPTRGLDVGATRFIRETLRATARAGAGVLLVSTDLDEVLELGDRIAVLFRGALLPVGPAEGTRLRVGELMLGGEA